MIDTMTSDVIGIGAASELGWSSTDIAEFSASNTAGNTSLEERVVNRLLAGVAKPQSKTRLLMIPVSAAILGLSRDAISREIYLRDTYERLGQEIREGQAPVELDGFLLHLKDVPKGEDAASWWNYAMAPFEFADLHWDNLAKRAVPGLGGHTPRAVRQICAEQYKIAHDRFGEFARMVRSGEFGLKAAPAVLIAARADSMRAVTAEQLYSLALLNEQKGWKLMRDANKKPLSVEWAASLLPSQSEVVKFSNTLTTFLSGEGWRKRIENNKAVLLAAIAKTGRSVATTSLAVLFVYGLASWTGPVNVATAGASSAMTDTVRIAGPGGTRPTTIAALGPGGTVATELVV